MSKDITEADAEFLRAVGDEAVRARGLFPSPIALALALAEEAGEVAKALQDEPAENVRTECIQLAAMALRLAVEGDPSIDGLRAMRGLDQVPGK